MSRPDLPTVSLKLWSADAVVLLDWLKTTDLNTVQVGHPAEKQVLADLLTQLEGFTDVPEGASGQGLAQEEIGTARVAVGKAMGW